MVYESTNYRPTKQGRAQIICFDFFAQNDFFLNEFLVKGIGVYNVTPLNLYVIITMVVAHS